MVRSAGRVRPGRRAAVSWQDGRRHLPRLERSESQSRARRRWRMAFGGSEGGTEKRTVDGREALGIRRRIRRRSVASETEVQSGHVCARRRVGGWCHEEDRS